jgi:hypothetical protein
MIISHQRGRNHATFVHAMDRANLLPNDIVKQQEKDPTCIDTVAVT